ncbi:XRE family transcriptional regulator [uncultured Vagococcus sp.]|uniref:helix-turn-helix domain-containing protein n=1 Tax=uncultured Vagococcus sp. TaxID=189676 RepID=UPI0028D31241|nr:XRE family transcriptional regulator [uncultured Vagococcus sp.]
MESIGETVKKLRKDRGYTLKDISKQANLSIGYLSQFERGITTIAVEQLAKIADILGVSINYFFDESTTKEEVVTRSYDQTILRIINQNIYKSLSNNPEDKAMMPKLVEMLPSVNTEQVKAAPHEGEEFIYVLEGILTLIIDGTEQQLYPGDSAHYMSSQPHNWANYTNKMVKFIAVHTPSDL